MQKPTISDIFYVFKILDSQRFGLKRLLLNFTARREANGKKILRFDRLGDFISVLTKNLSTRNNRMLPPTPSYLLEYYLIFIRTYLLNCY